MSWVCRDRWDMQKDASVRVIQNRRTLPDGNFHMASKRYAEEHAEGEVYVVADDDCLILGRDFIERGIAMMHAHPEYGLLGATSISDGMYQLFYLSNASPGITSTEGAGGVVFVRKGILTEFSSCDPDQVDDTIYQEFKRKGKYIGIMPHVKFNHLGAGYSVTSRNTDNWMA